MKYISNSNCVTLIFNYISSLLFPLAAPKDGAQSPEQKTQHPQSDHSWKNCSIPPQSCVYILYINDNNTKVLVPFKIKPKCHVLHDETENIVPNYYYF